MSNSKRKEPKKADEMTTEELAASVFPKEVLEHLKRLTEDEKPSQEKDTS